MKNSNLLRSLVAMSTSMLVFALAGQSLAITVGPGAFEYRYNSQNATGTGAADPNAVLDNVIFSGDGGAPNQPPNNVNFYKLDSFTTPNTLGTLTYTFDASAGEMFDGNASVTDRINVFAFLGNVAGRFSTDGGTTFTQYTLRGSEGPEYQTNSIDVNGATSVILQYTLFSLAIAEQGDTVQLFRQANVNLGGLEQTPFVFSGQTVPIPEPASIALGALACVATLIMRRKWA